MRVGIWCHEPEEQKRFCEMSSQEYEMREATNAYEMCESALRLEIPHVVFARRVALPTCGRMPQSRPCAHNHVVHLHLRRDTCPPAPHAASD